MQPYQKVILKNGLRVILVPDKAKQVVTSLVIFGVGSRYENNKIAGISHVLEHMFYKGTKKRPTAIEVAEFIENIGGEHNAFTSKEYTGFYTKVAARHLNESFDFLADLLQNALFRGSDLDKEKNVILQELDMYEDLPMEVAASKFEIALFGNNSLGRDTIGFKESIKSLARQDLTDYQKNHYTAGNCVIAIAGNFGSLSTEDVISRIEESFSFPAEKTLSFSEPTLPEKKSINITLKKTEQSHLVIGFRGASSKNPDKYALKILAMVLGGSMSSRMFSEIREKRGLAYAVRTHAGSYLDTGMIETYAGVPHNKVDEAISAISAEYAKVLEKIPDAEVARAKEIIFGKKLISLEDTSDLAGHYAMQELLEGKILTPEEQMAIIQSITADNLVEIANKYLHNDVMAISFVGPSQEEDSIRKIAKI